MTDQREQISSAIKISVVATVRNERVSIADFIETLLSQTTAPAEIVIVDGESSDGTREILQAYADTGKITLISQDCNIALGRNLGIAKASSPFIAVTDAGCRVEPTWLAHITTCFADPERPDVVAGNFKFESHSEFEQAVVLATFSPNREDSEVARYYPSSRSAAFTKAAWQRAQGYPEWLYAAEDTLFNIRLRQLGCKFVFCREAIVRWRPRENWKALAKQRFNFSRGNSRVGIGTLGYLTSIQYHLAILLPFALAPFWWPFALLSPLALLHHVRRHLWEQASYAAHVTGKPAMRWRVLLIMEFVRLVGMVGFIAGRWDRIADPSLVERQQAWMGVKSVDSLPPFQD